MADYEFSIVADFKNQANRGLGRLLDTLEETNDRLADMDEALHDMAEEAEDAAEETEDLGEAADDVGGNLFGGIFGRRGGMLQGFAQGGLIGGPQGGLGGIISSITKLTTKLVAMPGRIVASFAESIPKLGGIASSAVNGVVSVFQGLLTTLGNIAGHIVNAFAKAFKTIARVGGRVLGKGIMWGGIGAGVATGFAVRQAGKVQDAWNRVRTIMELGPKEAKKWMGRLRDEAIRTGKSLRETILGFYQIGSAGIREPAKAYQTLRASVEASVGGWTQLPTIVKTVTRTMTAFGKGADQARSTMDKLLQTVHTGQIELPEIAQYFASLGKMAAEANVSLDETLGMLGVIARSDEPNKIVTQLRASFMKLNSQTGQTRKALRKLRERGLAIGPDAIEEIGVVKWIDRLREVKRQYPKLLSDIFPERAFVGVTSLINMQDDIASAIDQVGDSAGTTRSDFLTMMDSVTAAAEQAWRVVQDLAYSYGRPTARWLTSIRDRIKESGWSMEWFRKKAREAGTGVRDALKGAYEYMKDLSEGRQLTWDGITDGLDEVKNDVIAQAQDAWSSIKNTLWPKIKAAFGNLLEDLWGMLGERIAGLPRMIGEALQRAAASQMQQAVKQAAKERGWSNVLKDAYNRITAIKEEGGPISAVAGLIPDVWQQLSGRMGPEQAAQFRMAQMMSKIGAGLTQVGSAGQQSARNARRRRWKEGLGATGRELWRLAERTTRGGGVPTRKEMGRVYRLVKKVVENRGGNRREQRKMYEKLEELLMNISLDLKRSEEERKKMKRTIERIATSRY